MALGIHERDREAAGTLVGSAVAFRLFLFFIPLLLFAVGLLGFLSAFLGHDDIEATGITGNLAAQIDTALAQPTNTRWIAVASGLVGMAITGRSLSRVLVGASCLSWRQPVSLKAAPRLIGGIIGLVVGVALIAILVQKIRATLGLAGAGVSFFAAAVVYVVAWLLVSLMLPRPTTDPGALLPGAAIVATVLAGMQAVSQLYLPDRFERASQLYGAIGTAIVTLGWFFILGRAMVLAMSVNAVVYERYGSISHVVFALPLLRQLPRRWPWFRTVFQLDDARKP
jgi:uncharacterized BrkB/YihY/UPF0761 family membrane protein